MTSTEIECSSADYEQYQRVYDQYRQFLGEEVPDLTFEPIADNEVEDRLKGIFKASFPLSNGSPLVQCFAQAVALDVLGMKTNQETIAAAFDNFELNAEEFYPPRRHADLDGSSQKLNSERLNKRIPEIWSVFEDIARNIDDPYKVTETKELADWGWDLFKSSLGLGVECMELWAELANRDIHYQMRGRPKAQIDAVKYRSTAKAHILDGVTTGNEEVDVVSQLTRASLKYSLDLEKPQPIEWLARLVRKRYFLLAKAWETQHTAPGQFMPEDFVPLLGVVALDESLEGDNWAISTRQ